MACDQHGVDGLLWAASQAQAPGFIGALCAQAGEAVVDLVDESLDGSCLVGGLGDGQLQRAMAALSVGVGGLRFECVEGFA